MHALSTVGEVKRVTEKELQEKRAKGLCYRCDAKWMIGHRCAKRELSVMLIEEEEGDIEGEGIDSPQSPLEELMTEVSLNSVIGLSNPKTRNLKGLLGDHEVIVMIDPGATHNFISFETVTRAGVLVTKSGSFGVSLGNGEPIKGEAVCKEVMLQLDGGVEIVEDFLPLTLGSSDIILGIQWGGFWVECSRMEATVQEGISEEKQIDPEFLAEVLEQHSRVFDSPVGLPPSRNHEHAITLRDGCNPVGVRPYRYPQSQKDEIERLIREMLEEGIIKPSTSPFSSPVLLVKKRWVMAVLRGL
ncbi:uncharacterized protein LOC141695725 [Apium graveolens]|uniref:uncharacterized protein LOC141695725 n=1 Tax=Apium graveolens TaxID=4045 RepID=UPI003D78F00A